MLLSSLAFFDRFEILEQIKLAPRVYALSVKEVVRRKDFASQYVKVKFVFNICYLHFCLLICYFFPLCFLFAFSFFFKVCVCLLENLSFTLFHL